MIRDPCEEAYGKLTLIVFIANLGSARLLRLILGL